ncbi:MAG: bestrophin family ion channel [Owenweeksia sp.]|nr:bestrophin family ion channel [Owenweeksia sp.]
MAGSYAGVLKEHLRFAPQAELRKLLPEFLQANLPGEDIHVPNYLANAMQNALLEMYQNEEISEAAYLAMLQDLNKFTDILGACERIKKTPIPYTYNIFIRNSFLPTSSPCLLPLWVWATLLSALRCLASMYLPVSR